MQKAKIAINGFGRIGRSFFRAAFAPIDLYTAALAEASVSINASAQGFDIVAINDLTDTKTLAYLLKYDSVYGRYNKEVGFNDKALLVGGREVNVFAEKDPAQLPWKDFGVDIVVESTGFFTSGDKAQAHIFAGAKRVVITAPATGDVATLLVGVNDNGFKNPLPITCNASCTTNSVAPVMNILLENFRKWD